MKIALAILFIALGVVMFVYAEVDDSPGGQLLGVIISTAGVYSLYKKLR